MRKLKSLSNFFTKLQPSTQALVLKIPTLSSKDSTRFTPKLWVLLTWKEIKSKSKTMLNFQQKITKEKMNSNSRSLVLSLLICLPNRLKKTIDLL